MKLKKKLDYKWVILACAFAMVFFCLGFCSGNKGMYLAAITEALGIKRSLFSINDSCRHIATAVINLFFGALVARYGIRKMVGFGFAALIASMLTYAFAENIFVFYIGGTLLGIGLAFTTTTIAGSIVRRWFKKNVGRYTGIVFAANGIGTSVAAQILSPIINDPENPFGYRTSYILVAAMLLVLGVTVTALLRERPKNEEMVVQETTKKKARGVSWCGTHYDVVKRRPYFWFAAASVFLTGFILQGIGGVYVAHMKDVGLDAGFVATVTSVYALTLTVSKLLIGMLYDRYGLRVIMVACQMSAVVAYAMLAFLSDSAAGLVIALVFGVLYAVALPLETIVIPLFTNELFGAASFDKILGIMAAMNYTGYAVSSPLVNLSYDVFGSYKPVLLLFSALMIPICIITQFVIRAANKAPERTAVKVNNESV